MKLLLLYLAVVLCFVGKAERPNAQSSNNLSGKLEPKYENPTNGSSSGDSNEVSGPSSSAVDSTDSGDHGNLADKQGPGFNGPEGVGENNGGSFRAGSLDTGSKSDSGSHNLSSGSGSRSNVSTGGEPSDKNEPADPDVSGRVTCPTSKTQSGSPSVA
uniref:Uncharacterized protein n=1 Tax=Mus spicilegus TaxID=10103 RepID=A0A8C6HCS1_MUSSI